jgi:ABC-type branched-subunit amino acid transport system permease subunit
MKRGALRLAALLAVAGLAPLIVRHPFALHIATQALIWALFAAAWDLLGGYTGQVSFGHAGFFALGAYAAALSTQRLGAPSALGLLAAMSLSGILGLTIGFPALRLRGHYLALVTLGFGEIVELVAQNWLPLTGGPFGLHDFGGFDGTPKDPLAAHVYAYGVVLVIALASLGALWFLCERTDAGSAFRAIREDQVLAESIGIDTTRYKLLAFTTSAAFAGLAGGLYAYYIQLVSPSVASAGASALVIGMAVFGGMGTIWGPFVGAMLLFWVTEALRFIGVVYNLIAVGLVMMLFVIFLPRGVAGLVLGRRGRRRWATMPHPPR